MGIASNAVALLMEEANQRPFSGAVLTLGKQRIFATGSDLNRLCRKFDFVPKAPFPNDNEPLRDDVLLRALGFSDVRALDYSDYEGADHVFDLNAAEVPANLREAFDVVLDSGTIEHVFHIPNVLKNVFNLVRVGGRVIFLSPSSNHFDHGFYMFSPTFFHDYYRANGFKIEAIYVVRYHSDPNRRWDIYEYNPSAWERFQIGGLDGRPYAIFLVATKTKEARWDVIPQQGFYTNDSKQYRGSHLASSRSAKNQPDSEQSTPDSHILASRQRSSAQGLRNLVKRLPGARAAYRLAQRGLSAIGLNVPGAAPRPRRHARY